MDHDIIPNDDYQGTRAFIDSQSGYYLRESGRWAIFLSVVGFVITIFLFICAVLMYAFVHSVYFSRYQSYANGKINVGWYAVILIVTSIFYFIPSLFLYQFGVRIKKGIDVAGQDLITGGLRSLKSFFRYWGIITIIIITFYVIVFVVAILGGIGLASLEQGS